MDASLKRYRDTIVSWLFLVGLAGAGTIWALEARTGIISPVDRIAYPIIVASCAVMPLLLRRLPRHRLALELISYTAVASYFAAHLTAVVLWGSERPLYTLATLLQWLSFLYVVAFLVFRPALARIAAGLVFLTTALPPLVALLWTGRGLDTEVGMLMINAYAVSLVLLLVLTLTAVLQQHYEKAADQARHMTSIAETDTLTGIANRRGLEQLLHGIRGRREHSIGLALMDLDHFKGINDRFGHLIGDELLVMTAREMQKVLRPSERAGRWGGEEFLLVILDADIAKASDAAERMRKAISVARHPLAGPVTVSAGVALWQVGQTLEKALAEADAALYAAKAQGRNRVIPPPATLIAA